uniref:Uncharacterized protein n=1 Tax=Candidatus Kentrum sp. FW TaxID=2126338 RepID=A0A450U2N7_9GAMM|nr:MAG: hypothetical protein BECKFW1821C_GA0114237_11214 [Candidatus Kentron sp. FW]
MNKKAEMMTHEQASEMRDNKQKDLTEEKIKSEHTSEKKLRHPKAARGL